jgi:hypothetical protein
MWPIWLKCRVPASTVSVGHVSQNQETPIVYIHKMHIYIRCIACASLHLSLSLAHTNTHTHTPGITKSGNPYQGMVHSARDSDFKAHSFLFNFYLFFLFFGTVHSVRDSDFKAYSEKYSPCSVYLATRLVYSYFLKSFFIYFFHLFDFWNGALGSWSPTSRRRPGHT